MANDHTKISWTDASWNPVTGCTHVSEGCRFCYAEALSLRFGHTKKPWIKPYEAENVKLHPERLDQPMRWKEPRRIFVNSMSDLFHELVPEEFIDDVFLRMALCDRHVYQILTKRPERMRAYFMGLDERTPQFVRTWRRAGIWPLPSVWLGVSVEDQRAADLRIPDLIATPAAVRFLSVEPMIGPVDLSPYVYDARYWQDDESGEHGYDLDPNGAIAWVIGGGESGPNHRPMEIAWLTDLAQQCEDAEIAFWCKQDANRMPERQGRIPDDLWRRKEWPVVATATAIARQEAMFG